MSFEIKKRKRLIIIAAVALDKNSFKAISFHVFIIVFNIRLKHGFRKIIILIDSDFEENFIFQRFVKENNLINDLIEYMRESIDGYAITIYGKHDLIIHIKNLGNQN
jgi:hypothetical protein